MTSYLFYDLETTGTNPCFDQIVQFAAIRTDAQFNEIDRHEFLVKLNRDTIPNPYAQITHQISMERMNNGISEFKAINKIHRLMNEFGTISLGYNTLGFDDVFLRFAFYRNLLSPYTHQYNNQCRRMDIYPITLIFYLFKRDILNWPEKDGRLSLKLEAINECNGFVAGQAHDAMVDVSATLALAKVFFAEQETWQYVNDYFIKAIDEQRLSKLPKAFANYGYGLMISGEFGTKQLYQAPVLILGQHHHYRNQFACLRLDLAQLRQTTTDNPDNAWVINKKLAEPGFILPPSKRFLALLNDQSYQEMKENLAWLQKNPSTLKAIRDYYCNYTYPNIPETDTDAALYLNGFWTTAEQQICADFHRAGAAEKSVLAARIRNPRLKELATRVLGRHFPQTMTDDQREDFHQYLQKVFSSAPPIDYKGQPRYSIANALTDITALEKQTDSLTPTQQKQITALKNYVLKLENY
ncbi:MAG: exonuclease domain-containing protein [Pseudomonadota bacterium]